MTVSSNALNANYRNLTRPTPQSGWVVTVSEWAGEVLATVPFKELGFVHELNGAGAATVTFDLDSEFLKDAAVRDAVLAQDRLWSFYEDNILRFTWIAEQIDQSLIADDLTRQCQISGPGHLGVLQHFQVLPPRFPSVDNPDGQHPTYWSYSAQDQKLSHLALWSDIFNDALEYRPSDKLASLTQLFDREEDGLGNPWFREAVTPNGLDNGGSLYQLLVDMCDKSKAEFVCLPGGFLDVRQTSDPEYLFGEHKENSVTFFLNSHTEQKSERDRDLLANRVYTRDNAGLILYSENTDSIAQWGSHEKLLKADTQDNPAVLTEMSAKEVAVFGEEALSWIVRVPQRTILSGGVVANQVFVDYNVGDWIGIVVSEETAPASVIQSLRVASIAVAVKNGTVDVELTLNTPQSLRARRHKQEEGSSGGGGDGGGRIAFHEDRYGPLEPTGGSWSWRHTLTHFPLPYSEHV
jgi:hypothetical protein